MTDVKPIRKKTLWQQYDFLKLILEATEELLPFMPPEEYEAVKQELAENRQAQEKLRARAEMLEGVRHG